MHVATLSRLGAIVAVDELKDDPRKRVLIRLALVAAVISVVVGSVGLASFPFYGLYVAATKARSVLLLSLGFLGWFPFLMFAFSARASARELCAAIAVGAAIALLLFAAYHDSDAGPMRLFFGPPTAVLTPICYLGAGFGATAMAWLISGAIVAGASSELRATNRSLLWMTAYIAFLSPFPETFLQLTASLQPATYDVHLYRFDRALGLEPSATFTLLVGAFDVVRETVSAAYLMLPLGYAVLFGVLSRRSPGGMRHLLLLWVIADFAVALGYHLLPATGPAYAFGKSFTLNPEFTAALGLEPRLVEPAARNAFPSMHFGWALLMWLYACAIGGKRLRAGFAILLGLNVVATLGLGEHYLIDLVVAVPFVVAVLAAGADALPWTNSARRSAALGGMAIWLGWGLAIRAGVPMFEAVPGLGWVAILATLAFSLRLYRRLQRAGTIASVTAPVQVQRARPLAERGDVVRVVLMFFASGFAGLVYEVLFSKQLALTFGSTALATYTVLATYMGGMAVGAWLGGRWAARTVRPLVVYAFCELAIALYCLGTPAIFDTLGGLYVTLAGNSPSDAAVLTGVRLGLGVAVLFIPTVLMGMTLPLVARFFEQRSETLGRSVALLYAANTLGAAAGALLTGYFILSILGTTRCTMLAAVLNMMVCVAALELHKRLVPSPESGQGSLPLSAQPSGRADRRLALLALAALGVGGVLTLAIEVEYVHMLAIVAGNSTYAFSLMLFTFLLGLGAGAEAARRLLRTHASIGGLIASFELVLAICIFGGVFVWDDMSIYFGRFAQYPVKLDFAAREAIRGIVCFVAMFPPAFCIGAIYPLAMEAIGRAGSGSRSRALGAASALNTAGNIVGVLLGAFVLLPSIGALRSIQLLGAVALVLAAVFAWRANRPERTGLALGGLVAIGLIWFQPDRLDFNRIASGSNVYFAPQNFGETIDHAESVDGGLTSVAIGKSAELGTFKTLLTNGKFQGNDVVAGEMQAQVGFTLAPLLHLDARERALVIGYGTGVSARTIQEAGFKHLDVVELSADVLRLADRHFGAVNGNVRSRPNVSTHATDGRNFLLLDRSRYDLIGMEISSIWFAGAASLYNREFYQLVKRRLQPQGVLQQWVQLHHLQLIDLLTIIGTVHSEFRYVTVYLIGGQGIIVASNDPGSLDTRERAKRLAGDPGLQPLLELVDADPLLVRKSVLIDPEGVERLMREQGDTDRPYWVSTDQNLYLEYSTPKGNILDATRSFTVNVDYLRQVGGRAMRQRLEKEE